MARAKSAKHAKDNGVKEDHLAKKLFRPPLICTRKQGQGCWSRFMRCSWPICCASKTLPSKDKSPYQSISFRRKRFDEGFRADLVVEGLVLVELESVEALARVHRKQVLTYLRLAQLKLGLLIHFGGNLLKGNIDRLVNGLGEPSL
jgi:GxxExxY protein